MKTPILAILCLLLTANYIQAQSLAHDRSTESLRGLNGIGLTIYFGRGEPLNTNQQATVIKALLDDAKEKFADAGIPLFLTAQPIMNAPGSPQLFIKIALNRINGYPDNPSGVPPMISDAWLTQTAYLSRDQSIQLSLTTWEAHATGWFELNTSKTSQGTIEWFRRIIEMQLNQFIKAYRVANPKYASNSAPTSRRQ